MYARQAVLEGQIAEAQSRLGLHRALSGEFRRLQTEVQLRLGVLTTTLGEAAKIRLENVSAQNRMTIVDQAIPPRSAEPGLLKLALFCLVPVILLFLLAVARQYLRESQSAHRPSPLAIAGVNGAGQKAITAESEGADSPAAGSGRR